MLKLPRVTTSACIVLVVLAAFGLRGDVAVPAPVSVDCASVGYAYDAAGRLVGVQDQTNLTARYAYDGVGNLRSVANDGTPDLAVLSVVPARAPAGTEVTISGGCFSDVPGENLVSFNGTLAEVTEANARRLVAVVPTGASSGPITVQVGGATDSSPDAFVVDDGSAAPTITGVSPTLVAAGDTVAVTGSGFTTDPTANKVTLNRTRALVSAVTASGFAMEVPAGAGSGRVRVSTVDGTGESTADVFVAPPPYTVDEIGYAQRTGFGEPRTVSIPTAGHIGLVIFDLEAGERAAVALSSGTFGSCGISTARVLDPFGNPVASDGCVGTAGFIDRFTATVSGTHTLLLPASESATGTITATVHQVLDDVAVELAPGGDPVTVTTTTPGQNASASFEGLAGQRIAVAVSDGTLSGSQARATLRDPDGVMVATETGCGSACFLDTMVLPADGGYRVEWDPAEAHTGSATIQAYSVPPDVVVATAPGAPAAPVTTTVPGQNAVVSFAGVAGQVVTVTAFGGSLPFTQASARLLGPDGATLESTLFCGDECGFDYVELPADGAYRFVWDPTDGQVGQTTVQVHDAADDAAASVAPGDPAVTLATVVPGQNAVVSFAGVAGQVVTVTAFGGSLPFTQASARLLGPDGATLESTLFCGDECGFDYVELPADGGYRLVWDPTGGRTGEVTVQVHDAADDAAASVAPGDPAVTLATVVPGQNAVVSFAGVAGQVVTVTAFGGSLPFTQASARLLGPDGATLESTLFCGDDCAFSFVALPADGTYRFVWDPTGGRTGGVTVQVIDNVEGSDVVVVTEPGAGPVRVTTAQAGQNAVVRFDATAGQEVTVAAFQGTFGSANAAASLRDPAGTVLASDTSCGTSCVFPELTLPADGTYELLIDPTGDRTGSITVEVHGELDGEDVVATAEPGGDPVSVATVLPDQNAQVRFEGTAGQVLTVTAYNGSLSSTAASARLLAPDGSTLDSESFCGTGCGFDYLTLPADGGYTLVWDPTGSNFGQITVQLHNASDDATSAAAPDGPPATLSTTIAGQNAVATFVGTAGQVVTVTAYNGSLSLTAASARLLAPDGSTLDSESFCGTDCGFDYVTLPGDGTYRFVWDPTAGNTGLVTVQLHDAANDAAATVEPGGAPATLTTTVAGQNAQVSFAGNAGQVVTVTAFAGSLSLTRASARLLAPDGSTLDSASFCGTDCGFDYVTLPGDGTYRLVWDPTAGNTGQVTLQLHNAANDAAATVAPGDPASTLTTTIAGQNARVSFAGSAGQVVTVTAFAGSLSLTRASARLLAPGGSTLDSASFCGTDCGFDYVTLPDDGTYTFVWDPTAGNTGQVTVQLHDAANDTTATVEIGGPAATVATTIPGQNARVSFDGTAGEAVTVTASGGSLSLTRASARLLAPDGSTLRSASFCGTSCTLSDVPLPATGGYTFVWDPTAGNTGQITVSVQDPASPAAAVETTVASDEAWVPDRSNRAGQDWRSHRTTAVAADLPAAGPGVTGVAGQVLLPGGEPLAKVTVGVGGRTTRTDAAGQFLLTDLSAGHHVLVVDGGSASTRGREFGRFEIGVDLEAGLTHQLPYPIWLSRIDTANAVRIASPTTEDTVVTTPLIPGLEVRLPAGTVVRDRDGNRVRELSITPIPVDQPPFPLPAGVVTPVYFTVQPGGAVILPDGAQVVYPNTTGLPAGSRVEFWDYDAERVPCTNPPVKSYPKPDLDPPAAAPDGCAETGVEAGWYVYGHGTVTADGRQVVPDPDVRVWEFTGTMINSGLLAALFGPGEDGAFGGDPVDLGTGLFVESHTDLVVQDVIPISITRTYRQMDDRMRPFGIGTNFNYGIFLQSAQQYQEADLVFPDSHKVHFVRTSAGTGFTDAVFAAVGTTGPFRDAVLAWNGRGWDLTRADGMTYVFGDEQPLQAIRDRHGNQVTLTRSGGPSIIPGQGGDIVQITSPNGRWIRLAYEPDSNRIASATDNGGRTVQYEYDEAGRLVEVTSPGGRTTGYGYDAEDRLTTITDARGITYLTNTYDSEDRVASQQLPDGATFGFAYTTGAGGDITATTVTDPEGVVRRVAFDADGRVASEAHAVGTPLERTASTVRDPVTALPTLLTDPYGRSTQVDYGPGGALASITTLAGTAAAETATITAGGPFQQLQSVTDEHGRATSVTYDQRGNPISVTDAEGRTSTYTYNAAGQLTSVTDPLGNATSFTYQDGDLVAVTDPLGHSVRQFVDAVGRVTAVADPLGATERVVFDPDNHVLATTDALGNQTSFDYDGNGNLTGVTDAAGHATIIEYDSSDRAVTVTDPLGEQAHQSYDLLDRPTSVTDRTGETSVTSYDELGRTVFIGYGQTPGPVYESTRTFSYDGLDRLATIDDSAGGLLTLGYDDLDQIISVASPAGTIGYSYDGAGRRSGMTVPGQPAIAYTYDDTGQIETITQGGTVATWHRDPAGRTIDIERAGVVTRYEYDAASRPVGLGYETSAGDPIGELTYGYGPHGRVVAVGGSLASVTIPSTGPPLDYDDANRLTSFGGQALSYDAEGRLVDDGTLTYSWNARGELTAVDGPGVAAGFSYDPAGRRATSTIGGTTTGFLYDGPNLVQEQSGGGVVADRLTAGLDQTLLRTDGDGARVPVTDLLGTVLGLVDTAGTLTTRYAYDPFGAVTAGGADSGNTQQYTGREYDADTGLLYNRARYYSPQLGRFISEDPAGLAGGSANLYAYALNDPVNLSDPNGDCPICIPILIGILVGGSSGVAIGWGTAALTGRKYTFSDGLRDFLIWGAVGGISGGLGAWLRGGGAVWKLNQFQRGLAIEAKLGGNLPRSFPVIDRFTGGVATSIKSVDLTAKTYQSLSKLRSLLKGYVDKVAGFARSNPVAFDGVRITPSQVTARELEIAVQRGVASQAQQQVLADIVNYAAARGVTVRIITIP